MTYNTLTTSDVTIIGNFVQTEGQSSLNESSYAEYLVLITKKPTAYISLSIFH